MPFWVWNPKNRSMLLVRTYLKHGNTLLSREICFYPPDCPLEPYRLYITGQNYFKSTIYNICILMAQSGRRSKWGELKYLFILWYVEGITENGILSKAQSFLIFTQKIRFQRDFRSRCFWTRVG